MSVRIPGHLYKQAADLGLQSWVASKQFPREYYFGLLVDCRQLLERRAAERDADFDESASRDALAMMIGGALDDEGALLSQVVDAGTVDFEDEKTWKQICITAGWCVLQLYGREHAKHQDG